MSKSIGRPRKPERDCMVGVSVSMPRSIRSMIDQLCKASEEGRSAVIVDLIERGAKNATIKRRLS